MRKPIARLFFTTKEHAQGGVPEIGVVVDRDYCDLLVHEVEQFLDSKQYSALMRNVTCSGDFVTRLCSGRSARYGQSSTCVVHHGREHITLKTPLVKSRVNAISVNWVVILQSLRNLLRNYNEDALRSYDSRQHFTLSLLNGDATPVLTGTMLPPRNFSKRFEGKVFKGMRQTYAALKEDTGLPLSCTFTKHGTFDIACMNGVSGYPARVWCKKKHQDSSDGLLHFHSQHIASPEQFLTLFSGVAVICS